MYYHTSSNFLGKDVMLKPQIPVSADKMEEGNIPRICVTEDIFYCMRAIIGCKNPSIKDFKTQFKENPCVYYTRERPFLPPNASDFRFNNEMWFLSPTKFTFMGRVDIYRLFIENIIYITNEKEISFPQDVEKRFDDKYTPKTIFPFGMEW